MILAEIKIHPEVWKTQTKMDSKKATCWTESKASHPQKPLKVPNEAEYKAALLFWQTVGVTAAGQKCYLQFSPQQLERPERIFTRILPIEESNLQYNHFTKKSTVECIEVWSDADFFMRVAPNVVFNSLKG